VEILGTECFWLKSSDIKHPHDVEKFQKEIVLNQIKAFDFVNKLNPEVITKMQDPVLDDIRRRSTKFESLVEEHGFDPRDTGWLETELASTDLEKKWFHFERTHNLDTRRRDLDKLIELFKDEYHEDIDPELAYGLSKKRCRFIDGSYSIRLSWEPDKEKWKNTAIEFSKKHEQIEKRMLEWSLAHKGNFPICRTKETIQFYPGPLWKNFVEKAPGLFTDASCNRLEEGILLQVVSYDPVLKYIRLNFPPDVIRLVDDAFVNEPWLEDWYVIKVTPEEIPEKLDLTQSLDSV